ncbi:MAG: sigma-70 family RNA polymerase sigma factor [Myxococcaceae bacterium]|nr:sigma-70 family RNA polymerase sigma factor [Myxococcaceae bacterium]
MLRLVPALPASDKALCDAFLAGDRAAFGVLVRRYQEPVFRVVRRYAGSVDEAKDLVQRAFLQAFEAAQRTLPRLAATPGESAFKAWLFRIAVNLGKNQARDGARWATVPLETSADALSRPADALEALERAEAEALTRLAVERLPPRQREVFSLRVDAALPFADVAEVLGISEGNAKSHFHYAVKRLRAEVHALASANPRAKERP